MFYVYVLKSDKDKKLYVGSTNDLKRWLAEHNSGVGKSTRYRGYFRLIYYEVYASEKDVEKRRNAEKIFWFLYSLKKKN